MEKHKQKQSVLGPYELLNEPGHLIRFTENGESEPSCLLEVSIPVDSDMHNAGEYELIVKLDREAAESPIYGDSAEAKDGSTTATFILAFPFIEKICKCREITEFFITSSAGYYIDLLSGLNIPKLFSAVNAVFASEKRNTQDELEWELARSLEGLAALMRPLMKADRGFRASIMSSLRNPNEFWKGLKIEEKVKG